MVRARTQPCIRLKRAYLPPTPEDGVRVLVDRLWPRGVGKSDAKIDHWMKELAPSSELRRWFGYDPAAGTSSAAVTRRNWRAKRSSSSNCRGWRGKAR